jgi:hypothetical protein
MLARAQGQKDIIARTYMHMMTQLARHRDVCGGCVNKGTSCVATHSLLSVIVWMDMICCMCFMALVPFIRKHIDDMALKVDEHNTTAADFTVIVHGVPPACDAAELAAFFDKYDGSMSESATTPASGEPADAAAPPNIDYPRPSDGGTSPAPGDKADAGIAGWEAAAAPAHGDGGAADAAAAPAVDGGPDAPLGGDTAAVPESKPDVAETARDTVVEISGDNMGVDADADAEQVGAPHGSEDKRKGGVAAVFLGRKCGDVLAKFEKRSLLQKTCAKLTAECQKLKAAQGDGAPGAQFYHAEKEYLLATKELADLDAEMDAVTKKGEALDVVCAFVMFNTQEAQRDCVRHYETAPWTKFGIRGTTLMTYDAPFILLNRFQQPELKFNGRALRVARAPEPTNVLWENLEVTRVAGFARRNLSSVLTFVVILISFAVIVLAKQQSENLKSSSNLCTNSTFVAACNTAVIWATPSTRGCPTSRSTSSSASCTTAHVWGLHRAGLPSAAESRLATPLDYDLTTDPATSRILKRDACRFDASNLNPKP